jgi:ubiquinone biosynthesis protein COQ9
MLNGVPPSSHRGPFSSTANSFSHLKTNQQSSLNGKSHKQQLSFVSLKQALLKEALEHHVNIYGFTNEAIAAATAATVASKQQQHNNNNTTISTATAGLISTSDLVSYAMEHYNALWKHELKEKVLEWNKNNAGVVDAAATEEEKKEENVEKISWALQRRLEYVQDLIQNQKWASAMAIGARPDNIWTTRTQLENMIYTVVKELDWKCSMVEQLSLGAVYVATELHMLADTSKEYQDTWVFLRQRVQDWDNGRRIWQNHRIDVPNNYHSPTDVLFTASTVASALFSGAMGIFGGTAPDAKPFLSSVQSDDIIHVAPTSIINSNDDKNDGTDPRHYDVPAKEKRETQ